MSNFDQLVRKGAVLVALLVVSAMLPGLLVAQTITAGLTGLVTDSSSAVVPNAKVSMTNDASGDVRRTVTNADGYFSFSGVFPGSYSVLVEAQGFAPYRVDKVSFTAGDKRTLGEIVLSVAATGTEVKVVGLIEDVTPVDSGSKDVVLTGEQMKNIIIVGQSAAEYIKILPGMAAVSGIENRPNFNGENIGINGNGDGGKQSAIGNFSANGTRTSALDITADGSRVSDPGCNCANPVNPNPEMIDEFKVQQSNFSAENSVGPVVINSITKGGGKDFHGSAFFYARNYTMNSNDSLNNAQGTNRLGEPAAPRPKNSYYFPGGTIGGPIYIPGKFNKNRDKLFFFTGYEYYKQTIDTGLLRAVTMTEAMRQGDFRNTAYLESLRPAASIAANPLKASMYPNGVIPVSDQDPGFTGLIKNLPMPNVNPAAEGQGYNWVDVLTVNQNMWQSSSRVDWNINDNTKLFVRYNIQKELQPFPIMLWWRNPGAVPLPTPINGQNVSDSISTNFTKVLSPTMTNEFIFGYTYVNFPNVYADYDKMTKTANKYPYTGIFPGQDPKIPAYWTWSAPIAGVYSTGGFDPTLFATKYLWNVNDNVSKVLGTHTLKFGGYWGYIVNEQPGNDVSNGQQIWDTWADTSSGNALGDILRGNAVQFNQATKQINRNEGYNEFAFFGQDSWKISPRVTLEYGLRIQHLQPWSARNGLGMAAWVPQDYNPNAPSSALSGVEWTAMNSKIPLSGAASRALFYAPRVGFAWDIFGKGKTVLRGGYGMFWYHDPQLGANAMDLPAGVRSTAVCCGVFMPYVDSLAGSNVPPVFNGNTMDSTDDRQPKTQTYSFTVSQRLKWRTMLEVAYVGSDSTNLINGNSFLNINQVPVGAMLNNPTGDTNAYRRLSNYQDLNVYNHRQYSNYNSLQVMATKQSGWANFTLAYTWSKAMGIIDTPINQLYGMMSESYAPLSSDRTQILAASYVINVPDLVKGGGNAFMKGVANGWQISGIVQANSGINIWQNSGSGNFYTAVDLPQGGTLSSQAVTGTNAWILSPLVTCNPRANLKQNQYINGSCFAPPVAGQNGQFGVNGPTVMPYFRGPGFFDTDLSVFKNFKMGEIRNLQFRASAYNLPNHPNRSFVSGDQNLRLNFAADGHITNPNFGYAGYTVGKRIIQLGVRFIF